MTRLVGLKALPRRIGDGLLVVAFVLALIAVGIGAAFAQRAQVSLAQPLFVIATDKLDASSDAKAVAVVVPRGEGDHIGVLLNKPTGMTMAMMFPDHAPSKNVTGPVYSGGRMRRDLVSMLALFEKKPDGIAFEVAGGVWLVFTGTVIDSVIETRPNEARYFVGVALWTDGALADQVAAGDVVVRPVEPEKIFTDPAKLHELLSPARGKQI